MIISNVIISNRKNKAELLKIFLIIIIVWIHALTLFYDFLIYFSYLIFSFIVQKGVILCEKLKKGIKYGNSIESYMWTF